MALNALDTDARRELVRRGFSRRDFGRFAALLAGGAASLPFFNESTLAQGLSAVREDLPPDVVRINANENPMGPCPEAAQAAYAAVRDGGRYHFENIFRFERLQADMEGLGTDYVKVHAGSSIPLHQTVLAFASPSAPLVVGDPGYEAPAMAARFIGAKTISVPLTKDYAHDVRAMAKAAPNAGVFYICNPNNPTGTVTPRADIEWLLANKPAGSVVLLDEAYIHIAGIPSAVDLVAADKDLIVLRTFSKLYGMAGLRAGVIFARPDLGQKVAGYTAGGLPVAGMAAAIASLQVSKQLVPERRKVIGDIRDDLSSWLTARRFSFVPSVSNKIMIDCRRPGEEVMQAMLREKVLIGRTWPSWPNHVRVSMGTRDEMEKFKTAFAKVMA